MSSFLARFAREEAIASAIEHALIAALIVLAIVVGAGAIGGEFARLVQLVGA